MMMMILRQYAGIVVVNAARVVVVVAGAAVAKHRRAERSRAERKARNRWGFVSKTLHNKSVNFQNTAL